MLNIQNMHVDKSWKTHIFYGVLATCFESMKSLFIDICLSYGIAIQPLKSIVSFFLLQSVLYSSFPSKQMLRKILYLHCVSSFPTILNFPEPRVFKSLLQKPDHI